MSGDRSTSTAPDDRGRLTRARAARAPDEDSRTWLVRLTPGSWDRERAVADLNALLLKAARFTLARRYATVRERREGLDELAVEAADDATLAVLAHLDDYRGESRFVTWAWKFAIVQTAVALRRREWTAKEIPADEVAWAGITGDGSADSGIEHRETLEALRRGVETELTPHQRAVFVAIALNGVPIDVLAERLSLTRGAVYKALHDARGKLRAYLASVCAWPANLAPSSGRRGT